MQNYKQAKKNKLGLFNLIKKMAVIFIMVMLVVSLVSGRMRISEKQKELDKVSVNLLDQNTKNEEMERLLEQGDEDAYIARYAREKLGYIWPGEKILLDITGK